MEDRKAEERKRLEDERCRSDRDEAATAKADMDMVLLITAVASGL